MNDVAFPTSIPDRLSVTPLFRRTLSPGSVRRLTFVVAVGFRIALRVQSFGLRDSRTSSRGRNDEMALTSVFMAA